MNISDITVPWQVSNDFQLRTNRVKVLREVPPSEYHALLNEQIVREGDNNW